MNATHRNIRACRRKHPYTSPVDAIRAYINLAGSGRYIPNLGIYRCSVCGNQHLGKRRHYRQVQKKQERFSTRHTIAKLMSRIVTTNTD